MDIEAKKQDLLEELGFFQDWTERYEYVIGLGKKLPSMPVENQTADKLIKGCQSQVWLDAGFENGVMRYQAAFNPSSSILRLIKTEIQQSGGYYLPMARL